MPPLTPIPAPNADPPPPPGFTVDNDPPPPPGYTVDAPGAPVVPPGNTISAAPAPSWGTQATQDLQEGGNRTIVGRTLGFMQGNGVKGYTGLESGVSPGAADYVGSPFLGAARTVAGAQEIPQHPLRGLWDTAKGVLQTATLPAMFMGGPVADAGMQAIPSRAAASKLFESVMQDAADVPVNLTQSMSPLERTQQLASRGASPVRAADQLFQRAQTVNPITYREARDFSSNLSRQSVAEKMATNPTMQRAVGDLSQAFKSDIGTAADTVGRGQDYRSAMQEYARAMSVRDAGLFAAKKVAPKIAAAAGTGAAYEFFKKH